MILILSESDDLSTTQIIEWLDFFDKTWIRINKQDKIKMEYYGDDIGFISDDFSFRFSEITSFWYRRGFFNVEKGNINFSTFEDFQSAEYNKLMEYVYYKLNSLHHLDSIKSANINKLIVSSMARDVGIVTPEDLIFSNKQSLEKFLNPYKEYITKSVYGDPRRDFEDFFIYNYTSKVSVSKVATETFFPSLVQNCIAKKYELRIFYMKGKFYSMAIFSQNDNQTSVDFRNYNYNKPNRKVPFQLPMEIEKKLDILMKKLDFNSGSIDMIVTVENEYVFLEVNPLGQFSMTSFPCNYNVEKIIAEYL